MAQIEPLQTVFPNKIEISRVFRLFTSCLPSQTDLARQVDSEVVN